MKQIKIWPVLLIVVFVVGCFVVGVLYNDTYVNITKDSVSTKQNSDTVKASELETVLTNDSIQPTSKQNENVEGQKNISKENINHTSSNKTIEITNKQEGDNGMQDIDMELPSTLNNSTKINNEQIGDSSTQKVSIKIGGK